MNVNKNKWVKLWRDIYKNKWKYILVLPVIVWLILFCYKPMYGIVIAFKNFKIGMSIADAPWVGLLQFKRFFKDIYFGRLLKNTFSISALSLLFSFPAPILLALLINEVKASWFKRTIQTVTYLPHFITMVVVCSLIHNFFGADGMVPELMERYFGGNGRSLLTQSETFYAVYIGSGIWQGVGWGSIIYLAALSGIDQEQYEAARIDGAGRLQQMIHITLPGLLPTVSMLLILNMGSLLNVGYEKIMLLYSSEVYDVADVISTYVYRKGLQEADYSFGTAVSLFNSVINIILLLSANRISKKAGQSGLF